MIFHQRCEVCWRNKSHDFIHSTKNWMIWAFRQGAIHFHAATAASNAHALWKSCYSLAPLPRSIISSDSILFQSTLAYFIFCKFPCKSGTFLSHCDFASFITLHIMRLRLLCQHTNNSNLLSCSFNLVVHLRFLTAWPDQLSQCYTRLKVTTIEVTPCKRTAKWKYIYIVIRLNLFILKHKSK